MDEYPKGALSQLASGYGAPVESAPIVGALGRTYTEPDVRALLAQHVPQDDSRDKYLALAAGFGSATKTGSFGESLGNVASALQDQKSQQEKLRAQYLPLIMQQIAFQETQGEKALKLQMMQQELKLKQLGEKRTQSLYDMQQDAYKGVDVINGGMPGQSGVNPSQSGMNPSQPGMPAVQSGADAGIVQGMQQGLPVMQAGSGNQLAQLRKLEKMALAGIPGAKEMFEIYKYKTDPMKLEQGATYENRMTGKREFMPKIGEGVGPDGAGNYGALPGYAGAMASIEGEKAGAVEGAKAQLDPYTMTPKGASNPILTNRKAAMTQSQPGVMGSGYAGGSRDGANAESIQMMVAELKNPQLTPADKSGILREISRMQQQSGIHPSGGGGVELQSEAEKATAVDQAKANVKPIEQRQNALAANQYMLGVIDKALSHPGLSASTGLQGLVDPRNYIPGTDARNFGVLHDQLKGNTFLQAYEALKGGGAITDIEGQKGTDAIGRLNRAQSTDEFKEALNDLKTIIANGGARMQKAMPGNQGGASGNWGGAPASPAVPSQSDIAAEIARRAKGK